MQGALLRRDPQGPLYTLFDVFKNNLNKKTNISRVQGLKNNFCISYKNIILAKEFPIALSVKSKMKKTSAPLQSSTLCNLRFEFFIFGAYRYRLRIQSYSYLGLFFFVYRNVKRVL